MKRNEFRLRQRQLQLRRETIRQLHELHGSALLEIRGGDSDGANCPPGSHAEPGNCTRPT